MCGDFCFFAPQTHPMRATARVAPTNASPVGAGLAPARYPALCGCHFFLYIWTMGFTSNTATKIASYVEVLKESDQEKLLNALERKVLMDEAARLNKSVKKNTVSIEEICELVADVRKKHKQA
jgi:hypothetical protein